MLPLISCVPLPTIPTPSMLLTDTPRSMDSATLLALSTATHALSNLQAPAPGLAASGAQVTVTWASTSADTDPVTLALYSTNPTYNGPFAVENNINPQDNKATFEMPDVVPGPGYTIALISMNDTSDVLASSPPFSVPSSTASASALTTAAPATLKSVSASASHVPLSTVSISVSGSKSASAASKSANASASTASQITPTALSTPPSASLLHPTLSSPVASSTAHSVPVGVPSPSPSAKTGGARSLRVPGVALVGLVIGAWAV
ncbi:hypothetical protein DFH07DRAFT_968717 [Mycena maculata]|uniref:Yeast cell wall synthesis Kre9/Knh1-like N-terminal domain-containing protein n=1 Tax=Mycena maculata TaxID=230809 RepID=A0AAD7HZB1_9AGAR|nr:hypothetical protein DFH07DRAFT_968717 [Mycena maculata]